MEVSLALLADCANISREGKLNVLGIFNTVCAQSLPSGVISTLVLRFVADPAEKGARKNVEFKLLDPDGKQVASQSGELQLPPEWPPGMFTLDLLSPTPWVQFHQYGPHRLVILVGGETKCSVDLIVAPPPSAPSATES